MFHQIESLADIAKYAYLLDRVSLRPFLYDALVKTVTEQTRLSECEAGAVDAKNKWALVMAIESPDKRLDETANIISEIWSWSHDLHLRTAAALALFRLGKESEEQKMYVFSMMSNSGMLATLGKELSLELGLSFVHWHIHSQWKSSRTLSYAFSATAMRTHLRVIAENTKNEDGLEHWSKLLSWWCEEKTSDFDVDHDDLDYMVSVAVITRNLERLEPLAGRTDLNSGQREVVERLLTECGKPSQGRFETDNPQELRRQLHALPEITVELLTQIFDEVKGHGKVVLDWLRYADFEYTSETKALIDSRINESFLDGIGESDLAPVYEWLAEKVLKTQTPADLLKEFPGMIQSLDASISPIEKEATCRGIQWRIAAETRENLALLFGNLGIKYDRSFMNSYSGWDSWIERMEWVSEIREADLIFSHLINKVPLDDLSSWSIRKDDKVTTDLWSLVKSTGNELLLQLLSGAYKNFKEFNANAKRSLGQSCDEIVPNYNQWVLGLSDKFCLYDAVDVCADGSPELIELFFVRMLERIKWEEPGVGNLNAWIKFTKQLKEAVDGKNNASLPVLKRVIREWADILDGARGILRDSDLKSADREMARTIAGDSAHLLSMLVA